MRKVETSIHFICSANVSNGRILKAEKVNTFKDIILKDSCLKNLSLINFPRSRFGWFALQKKSFGIAQSCCRVKMNGIETVERKSNWFLFGAKFNVEFFIFQKG